MRQFAVNVTMNATADSSSGEWGEEKIFHLYVRPYRGVRIFQTFGHFYRVVQIIIISGKSKNISRASKIASLRH